MKTALQMATNGTPKDRMSKEQAQGEKASK